MNSPIGIFDSGLGGLSIAKSVERQLPDTPIIYIADSGYAPYGDKSQEYVLHRARQLTRGLLSQGCKLIVVACNTATVNTINVLRQEFAADFVGVEPGIKPALSQSQSKIIAVIATERTVESDRFQQFVASFTYDGQLLLQACPGLMEQVEKLQLDTAQTRTMLQYYIEPLLQQGADTLVLGCTHYPFLQSCITQLFGNKLNIINTSDAVAQQVKRLYSPSVQAHEQKTCIQFFTSGETNQASAAISYLWGQDINCLALTTLTTRTSA